MKTFLQILKYCALLIIFYLAASVVAYGFYAVLSFFVYGRVVTGLTNNNQLLMSVMYILNIVFLIVLFRQNQPAFLKAFRKPATNVVLNTFYGLFVTAIFIGVLYGILYLLTDIQFAYKGVAVSTLLQWFVMLYFAAMIEEVLCRNLMLDRLIDEKGYNPLAVLFVSSLLFSLLHLFNDNFSVVPFINIVLVGIIFGIIYLKYKNIYLVTAIHFFWNYITGLILGSHVSGIAMPSVFTYKLSGSELVSGGGFGIEGSVILVILQVIVIAVYTPFLIHLHKDYRQRVQATEVSL